ncbi:hypothetical protein CYMTET_40199 [Cymbomonas tetramitiformis]|uniref:Uncharacterized protein n=1 Tax=Cymbomonas tetramitiformis TaxID=36881 RepID=A0AAE0C8I6_9CHLO|nr:hypothetical protein CYMTET_40199 [Cymbomonas tetramitiformis]
MAQLAARTKHSLFDVVDRRVYDRVVGLRLTVAAFCFNCTSSVDNTPVEVRVVGYQVHTTPKSVARVVLRVVTLDDGARYTLPDWALFSQTGTIDVFGRIASAKRAGEPNQLCERAHTRNLQFADACHRSGVRSALVLDGAAGSTSRALRQKGIEDIYQANQDATALIALAVEGDVVVHTTTSVRAAHRRGSKQSDVYELLRLSRDAPNSLHATARSACYAQALALDIYGTWRPEYDRTLQNVVDSADVRALLVTFCTRNSTRVPVVPFGYITITTGEHRSMRWSILVRIDAPKKCPHPVYAFEDMTVGSMMLVRVRKKNLWAAFTARSKRRRRVSAPCQLMRVSQVCAASRALLCEVLQPRRTHFMDDLLMYRKAAFTVGTMRARVHHDRVHVMLAWDPEHNDMKDALPLNIRKKIERSMYS